MSFLKQHYGPVEGPLGFPMPDRAAQALDAILRGLPKSSEFAYRKMVREQAASELLPGERCDVSWISSEEPDRANEVVLARGMDDSQFKLNPIVTLQHAYALPPVGKSLWRKVVRDGHRRGVKAKTHYPPRPDDWPKDDWPPDAAFSLIQADLLRGKSIGFLPTKVHAPTKEEKQQDGWQNVDLVIDEWVLLEYACCFLPCQQNAVVEAVSRSLPVPDDFLRVLGVEPTGVLQKQAAGALPDLVPFTTAEELEKAVCRALAQVDLGAVLWQLTRARLDERRGRV